MIVEYELIRNGQSLYRKLTVVEETATMHQLATHLKSRVSQSGPEYSIRIRKVTSFPTKNNLSA